MGKKNTYNQVKTYIENLGYKLISEEYINSKSKLILVDSIGYYYTVSYSEILGYPSIDKVSKYNPYSIQNIKLWLKINNKPMELISDIYENALEYLEFKCLKDDCGEIFKSRWNDIKTGYGCGYCSGQQVGLSNCLATKNPELAKDWHPFKNGELTPYNITSNSGKHIWWQCNMCNHEWYVRINSRTNKGNNCGCPKCAESHGEKQISKILLSQNIKFEPQKKFDNLVGLKSRKLSYDFYLHEQNLLIEYQGQYHDGTARNQTEEEFFVQQEHDKYKRNYAKKNNINLLEIWYWDFKNIEDILNQALLEKFESAS